MPTKNSKRKIIYLKRKKLGLCPRCGNKIKKRYKYIFCEDCREFFRNYNRETSETINKIRKDRYDKRKRKKQCPRCGKQLGKKYKKIICAECLKKQYKYNYGKDKPIKK
jgi:Zn finger protein HypA/HybF involved in hydrogenase expression